MLQIIVNYSAKFTYKFKQCEKFNVEKSIIFDIFMNLPWKFSLKDCFGYFILLHQISIYLS